MSSGSTESKRIVIITWDPNDDDCLYIDHDGVSRFEAMGMLEQALEIIGSWEPAYEEGDTDG